MELEHGVFVVSLDFELYWGMPGKKTIEQYSENLRGVRNAVDEMLSLFDANGIHATWATVGFLYFKNSDELKKNLPQHIPQYAADGLSTYSYIEKCGHLEAEYHFAPEVIEKIRRYAGQEIGTHTFSHYYCLEEGQSLREFKEDILQALRAARAKGISVKSLVFPRNQWNKEYLSVLAELGIRCYRGNESHWIYNATDDGRQGKIRRVLRLLDNFVNISGYNTYKLTDHQLEGPIINLPSSRFLRPYFPGPAFLNGMRLKRITEAMTDAAINHKVFHLWWHPHNFGMYTQQNISFLGEILKHFKSLEKQYGMQTLNMGELSMLGETSE
jgi:peptidoglycan/xylan/chitin deacetylase (PgdA/CDA1 family)